MATVERVSSPFETPPVLHELRSRIKRYVALEGSALGLVVLRLVRDFRTRALALVLERRFPELNDRLITAVELSESRRPVSGLTAAMLQRTADEAADLSRRLELREVFNVRPLVRAIAIAVV